MWFTRYLMAPVQPGSDKGILYGDRGKIVMNMENKNQLIVFWLDAQGYALHLSVVEKVVRAAEITPLPKAPEIVLGVINVRGKIIPVVDVRRRFRLPEREIEPDDRFIIAHTARRQVALSADSVTGLRELTDQEIVSAPQVVPFTEYIKGIAKIEGDLVLIHDLEGFLSLDEEQKLDTTLLGVKE